MSSPNGCFDWASSFYDYTRAVPDDLIAKTVEILQEKVELNSSSRILEVGVGTGRIAIPFSKKLGLDTIGLDISGNMLQKCLEKITPHDNVHLLVADGLTLPFSKNQFDMILTCHMLQLIPDAFQFVKKIIPLLIPNGYYQMLDDFFNHAPRMRK